MKTCRAITTALGFTTAGLTLWAGATGWAQETPSANETFAQINAGQGTVGKLVKDEALHREATNSMTQAREILRKINQGQGSVGKPVNDRELLDNAKLTLQKLDQATEALEDQGLGRPLEGGGELLPGRLPENSSFTERLRSVDRPARAGAVSVTTFGKPDQKRVDQIAEDLRILSYLFSKNLERAFAGDSPEIKLGIPMLLTANGDSVEASYLDGFGVVLRMRVGFPLVAPPGLAGEPGAVPEVSEWDEARRALAGAEAPEGGFPGVYTWDPQRGYGFSVGDPERYSSKLVEALKKHTLALLKNASNLRDLKPDEWIVVSIAGPPGPGRAVRRRFSRAGAGAGSGQHTPPDKLTAPAPGGGLPGVEQRFSNGPPSGPDNAAQEKGTGQDFVDIIAHERGLRVTMMTIRVKKADADAFAAGTLSEEQFAKEAEVGTYLGPVPQDRATEGGTRWLLH